MSALYTPTMLALATQLADYPFDDSLVHQAQSRSKICGSSVRVGLDLDRSERVARIGLKVSACAVGQSSAAILAGGVAGATFDDLARQFEQIEGWLSGASAPPNWPRFEALLGARDHPGRHGALVLPWQAALSALSSVQLHR
ncbi:MAG: iron-sulfur cluster assembly scaffold protein [Pseudomonadota bacterium]